MQPIIRMPHRDQISNQNVITATSSSPNTTARDDPIKSPMAAIPSMGGPELMMDDDDFDRKPTASNSSTNSSAGLKKKSANEPPPHHGSASAASPQRQRDAELKKQAASKPGAIRPGAMAVSGTSGGGSVASSGTRNSGLELAPGFEGEAVAAMQPTTDTEIKRAATRGSAVAAMPPAGDSSSSKQEKKKTGAAALLTDEEMKAAAVAASRAYAQQQQQNTSDSDIKAQAAGGGRRTAAAAPSSRPAEPTPSSSSRPTAAYVDAPSGADESKSRRAQPPPPQHPPQQLPQQNTAEDVNTSSHNDYMPPVIAPGTATFTSPTSHVSEATTTSQKKTEDDAADAMEAQSTAIVAELAPDEDAVADRIAERVRAQMEQRYGKLEEEKSQKQTAPPVMAVKMEDAKTATSGLQDNDNEEDGWSFCGLSKACVVWTTFAIILVIIGGIIGAIFGAGLVGGDDDNTPIAKMTDPPLVPATTGPTKRPPTDPPTLAPINLPTETPESERFELLWDLIGADIAQDPTVLRNPETSQYKALEWLANRDPASPQINDVFAASLIERYVILVLTFQNGVAASDNLRALGFLSGLPVCAWYDSIQEKGIECEGPWVSGIRLREYYLNFG
jgi:hypothetical protein